MLNQKSWALTIAVGLMLSAPSQAATRTNPKLLHVLNRLSFGPQPGDIAKVEAIGIERYIQQQLSPASIPEPSSLAQALEHLPTLRLNPLALSQHYSPQRSGQAQLSPEIRRASQQRSRQPLHQAMQARLLRATTSPRQLQEVMVDFWFNHFNVYSEKGLTRLWIGSYEESVIRRHALGNVRELLGATARHPAMLFYLDNWQNTAPGSPGARGRFNGLNENYARELMELHTLGVNGGYTQKDVIALAQIFTGWGLCRGIRQPFAASLAIQDGNGFCFDQRRHDFSTKVFLGRTIQGRGMAEGEQALDILAQSPKTARHLSTKLAQSFVADQPPPALVDRLTQRYLSTKGDIRAVLDTLFHSPEFWNPRYYNAKFKTPYQYVVSAIRATGVPLNNVRPINTTLQQLGMPLYGRQTPDGYPNTKAAWLNPDAITRRLSFATALASGQLLPVRTTTRLESGSSGLLTSAQPAAIAARGVNAEQLAATLGHPFAQTTQSALAASPAQLRSALILGSPEFMHR
jgi:uncharacterized protein (DUF1800 family)